VPRWAIAVAVVVALVPATYLTAHRAFHDSSATPGNRTTDLPIPPVSPSSAPSPTASPTSAPTSPAATPTPLPARLSAVPADAPRRITSGDLLDAGFDSAATRLDASSTSEVTRWESRGSPGSPGVDTVYVVGRVLADGDSAFAGLPELTTGDQVAIRTDSGTLTYTVTASTTKPEESLQADPLFTARAPGRLVLVGIRYDGSGNRVGQALVVTAELTGATRG
jgi:hypothetical protein